MEFVQSSPVCVENAMAATLLLSEMLDRLMAQRERHGEKNDAVPLPLRYLATRSVFTSALPQATTSGAFLSLLMESLTHSVLTGLFLRNALSL